MNRLPLGESLAVMFASVVAYRRALWHHAKATLSGAAVSAFGLGLTVHPVALRAWAWGVLTTALITWIQFLAFRSYRVETQRRLPSSLEDDVAARLTRGRQILDQIPEHDVSAYAISPRIGRGRGARHRR